MREALGDAVDYRRVEVVGPRVSSELLAKSTIGLGLAIFAVTTAPILVVSSMVDAVVAATHLAGLRVLDEVIADSVSLGLGIVLSTVVALDLRARFEGADLEAALDAPVT